MPSSESVEESLPLLHSLSSADVDSAVKEDDDEDLCSHLPARYVMAATGFLGFTTLFSSRASFSVAIVAMVNATSSATSSNTSQTERRLSNNSFLGGQERSVTVEPTGDFNWDETTQGVILGAFFYGYFWPQMLFGHLAHKIGGKWVMAMGLIGSSTLNLLNPIAAQTGVGVFVIVRVLQGISESATFPAMHSLLGVWSPSQERSRLSNLTYLGVEIGSVLGMVTAGLLSLYGFAGGWPSIFYIYGILGCVLGILWLCLVHDTPAKHPRITTRERHYIGCAVVQKETLRIPWRCILTSPAVWAVSCIHFVVAFGFTSVMSLLPTYMANILHFGLEQNGLFSALPFVAQMLVEVAGSITLDFLHNSNITPHSRKLFNTLGGLLTAAFFVATGYAPADTPLLAVALVSVAVGCNAMCVCTLRVSHLDIAPRFGGTLYAVTNTFANMAGFISPAISGALLQNQQTVEQWRVFFNINAGLYVVGALVFQVWGKSEEQEWAKVVSSPLSSNLCQD